MVSEDDHSQEAEKTGLESRAPTLEDLLKLCRELNRRQAKYIVIGGLAMLQQGFLRATEDIDLLLETSAANESRVIEAIATLPDHAANELQPGDIAKYEVIRVADEVVVDLMSKASGIDYEHAKSEISLVKIQDVEIPFASASLLIKMKQGMRPKDQMDLLFLKEKSKS